MVLSAEYIKKKLEQEMVLSQAFGRDLVSHFTCQRSLCLPCGAALGAGATASQAPTLSDAWLPAASSLAQPLPPP